MVDVSSSLHPAFKYRKGMLSWKVFHRGKGAKDPPMWYSDWRSVPEHKRYGEGKSGTKETLKLVSSMFHDIYTVHNNMKATDDKAKKADDSKDPTID